MFRKFIAAGTLVLLVLALASPLAQAARYGPQTSVDPAPTHIPDPGPGPAPTFTPGPNPGPAPTVIPGPAEQPILNVQVHFQGRPITPDSTQALPVSYELQLGSDPPSGGDAFTDVNGRFSVDLSQFKRGDYALWVKSPMYLANATSVYFDGNYVIETDSGTLLAGDANDDNVVNTLDYSILKNTLGKSPGDTGYDARANFDGNKVVDKYDAQLLFSNFDKSGAKQPK